MQAIVYKKYGPPDVLQLEEVEKPVPADDQVLIKIHAATVSATDIVFRKGKPWSARAAIGLTKPKHTIPGDVLAGEIEAVGKDVKSFNIGDPVYGSTGDSFGAHAEYICLSETGALALKPSNLSFAKAAALCEGALTALPFLRDTANIQKGQSILINGASGSIGTLAVQLAKYFGANVTGVCSTKNVDWVKSLGADKVIDYTREDFTQTGDTYDIIFDTVGKSSFSQCKNSLKPNGLYLSTVLSFGILLQMLLTSKSGKKQAKIAFTGLRSPGEKSKDLVFLKNLAESGRLKPVIDRHYPLAAISEAHRYVETGHKKGAVVLDVTNIEQDQNDLS
jgi:NADPH:quinone reductase-like Zn-dependent oxidoreductase